MSTFPSTLNGSLPEAHTRVRPRIVPPSDVRLLQRIKHAFPEGHALPEPVWNRRHRGIVVLLFVQAAALFVFAAVRGFPILHSAGEATLVAMSGALACRRSLSRKARAGVATFGLVTTSALLVHFSGGVIETHFHFFVMLAVISLYQDWTSFLLALGFVVVHHGLMGALSPTSVYNHPSAWANPWKWAAIHGGFVLAASAANVVAWRLNEDARAHSALLLDSAGEGIFGVGPDGAITFVNQAAARMLDRRVEDVIGHDAGEILYGPNAQHKATFGCAAPDVRPAPMHDTFLAGEETFPVEHVSRPIVSRGRVVGTVVTFRDITERTTADQQQRETLSLLSATLESTADGILVVDAGGKISSINHQFVQMWRIPEEVLATGKDEDALAFVLEQLADPEGFLAKVRELYSHPDAESQDTLLFKDGRVFERYSKPQRVGGESVGRVWSFRDVTERSRLDDMKNAFLSAVSHELRTPLSAVLGYAVTLERADELVSPQERKELLGRLSVTARKLERLLVDTLDLDRLSRGILAPRLNPTDLGELVSRVLQDLDLPLDRDVQVEAPSIVLPVDSAKVERIVENLLLNAARHTPPGTPVWIRVFADDGGAVIAVDDAGPGVPHQHRDAIFESFQQGPDIASHSPGVGIGLSLVARFAELHGGRAWVEERKGGGSSFRVFLPGAEVGSILIA